MKLLDKLRPQPGWESADPTTRVAAVRDLVDDDGAQQVLLQIAQNDDDPSVRREAVVRIGDLDALVGIIESDSDGAVRADARGVVRDLVIEAEDAAQGESGVGALSDEHDLIAVARTARLEAVSRSALSRLTDQRALGSVARRATRGAIAKEALAKLDDHDEIQAVAVKTDDKTIALLAFDRLTEGHLTRDVLEHLGKRAKQKAVQRRARAALSALDALVKPPPPSPHAGVCDRLDALANETDLDRGRSALDHLLERWADLDGAPEVDVAQRFAAAREAAESRLAELEAVAAASRPPAPAHVDPKPAPEPPAPASLSEEQLASVETVVVELEKLVGAERKVVSAARWAELDTQWRELMSEYGLDAKPDDRLSELRRRRDAVEQRRTVLLNEAAVSHQRAEQEGLQRIQQRCRALETLAASEDLGLAEGERQLRTARRLLDDPGPVPRKHRDQTMRKLRHAHTQLLGRVHELRDFADWQRWANLGIQESLCRRMEALVESPDEARDLVQQFRDIMVGWRQAADVPKDRGEELWQRFKKAHDAVHPRYQDDLDKQAAERDENLAKLTALVEEAEKLADSSDWLRTVQRISHLQTQWKSIGAAPRKQQRQLWTRFRAACNTFFSRRKADLADRKKQWAENLTRKEALCASAEALAESDDLMAAIAEVKRMQAAWKTIGPVRRSRSDALWQRFRSASDAVFERARQKEQAASAERVAVLEALCSEVEALAEAHSDNASAEGLAGKVRELQQRWRVAPEVPSNLRRALSTRFGQGLAHLAAAHPDAFRGTELDPNRQLRRLEELCKRVEAVKPSADLTENGASPAEILASKWRDTLASNLMGARIDEAAERRTAVDEVKRAKQDYRRIGTVSGEKGQQLAQRFRTACEQVLRWAASGKPEKTPGAGGTKRRSGSRPAERPDRPTEPDGPTQ